MSTPIARNFSLSARQCPSTDEEIEELSKISYANAAGCLINAIICTRSGTTQAVGLLSKYIANPRKKHWNVVKWILRYLKGAKDLRVVFEIKQEPESVVGYVKVLNPNPRGG